jgi:hypothetical protein
VGRIIIIFAASHKVDLCKKTYISNSARSISFALSTSGSDKDSNGQLDCRCIEALHVAHAAHAEKH